MLSLCLCHFRLSFHLSLTSFSVFIPGSYTIVQQSQHRLNPTLIPYTRAPGLGRAQPNQITDLPYYPTFTSIMSETRFAQFKLVLLGESAVGKSSIVHRFVKNTFDDMRESTIGAAFLTQTITLPEVNTTVKFEIWDTAGQERYKSLAPMYYRNANAALCVYDITSQSSFQKAQDWINELKKQAPEGIVVALVGNKADLSEQRQVAQDDVDQYLYQLAQEAEQDGSKPVIHMECSAKSGQGVLEIFNAIARALPVEQAGNRRGGQGAKRVELDRRQPQQQQGCC